MQTKNMLVVVNPKAIHLQSPPFNLLFLLLGGLGLLLLLLLLLLCLLDQVILIQLLALRIPLARLQDQDTNQDKDKDSVAGGHDLEAVLATQDDLPGEGPIEFLQVLAGAPDIAGHGTQALDDIGNIDTEPDDVEDERGAVEEHVGLGGPKQLDEKAQEADGHDDV